MSVMLRTNQSRFFFESAAVPPDALQVVRFSGVEEISSTYRFVIQLASEDGELDLDAPIGQPATLRVLGTGGDAVPIHGIIAEFRQGGRVADAFAYEAVLVPRLSLLALSHQCRVFQHARTDEIVTEVLKQAGFGRDDFRFALRSALPTREYCVQYRETDLNFVQRLLEHDGISYFFEQGTSGEVVVFTDDHGASPDIAGMRRVEYHSGAGMPARGDRETIAEFTALRRLVTGTVVLKDYNYRTPEAPLVARASAGATMPGVFYDYGAHYKDAADGERLARARGEEIDAQRRLFDGASDCVAMRSGHRFALAEHFRGDFNVDYLITRVEHEGTQGRGFGIGLDAGSAYRNRFTAVPASTPFRPARTTPIPRLSGIITARLETGGGDYAYIDDQGRYRVKLPFDLSGRTNGTASRAVRMAQPYSGPNYGMHFPNHAGAEMVLACVDGDVDRPLGLSTIPNPANGSPSVAGNAAQSVIRTAGQNELTFDDTIGGENIFLHGTKDWTIDITNDKSLVVGNNETKQVGVDQALTVGSNQTIAVGANQSISVTGDRSKIVAGSQSEVVEGSKTIAVAGTHDETIGASMSQTVSGTSAETIALAKALSVGAAYQVSVGAAMNETIGGVKAEEIGGAKIVAVAGVSSENVGVDKSVNAVGSISDRAGRNVSMRAGADVSCRAGKSVAVQAGNDVGIKAKGSVGVFGGKNGLIKVKDRLVLKCGRASITLTSSGEIRFKGTNIGAKGSGRVKIKGTRIAEN
jgi:type VI secretion system secreted protein VgrG